MTHLAQVRVHRAYCVVSDLRTGWSTVEKPSTTAHDWYVLVGLEGDATRPTFHVIPRDHVAACIYAIHREWLSRSSKSGQPHRDNPRRGIPRQMIVGYQDKWDLLTSPPANAPWLFDQAIEVFVRRFGRDHDQAVLELGNSSRGEVQ